MKKNEHFIVRIEDMSEDGAGVGKTDGFIWFIKDTVIGDTVEASAIGLSLQQTLKYKIADGN